MKTIEKIGKQGHTFQSQHSKKRSNFFLIGDFEVNNRDQSVYLAGFMTSLNSQKYIYTSLKDFIVAILAYTRKYRSSKTKTVCFFNNGSKYDFEFILKFIQKNKDYNLRGFIKKNILRKLPNQSPFFEANLHTKLPKPKINDYEYLTNNSGDIYELKIWINSMSFLTFHCSYKLFLTSVFKMGLILNKKELQKGIVDYQKYRKYDSIKTAKKDTIMWDYFNNDLKILLEFLKAVNKYFSFRNWRLTVAGTAMNQWKKKCIDSLLILWNFVTRQTYEVKRIGNFNYYYLNRKRYKTNTSAFKAVSKKVFPLQKIDEYYLAADRMKDWYTGGLTHVNPSYVGKIIESVKGYDINSSYPSIMNSIYLLPYGIPKKGDGGKEYPLKLWKIEYLELNTINNSLPFIRWKSPIGNIFYKKNLTNGECYLTNYEYDRFLKCYEGIFTSKIIFSFKAVSANQIFGEYIHIWYKIKKQKENPYLILIAKLMMNSLYGKLGSNNEVEFKILNDKLEWETQKNIEKHRYYLPLAIFITSLARCKLIDAVANQYHNVLYLDTDSIFVTKDFNVEKISVSLELGEWKLEKDIQFFVATSKKRYGYIQKNTFVSPELNLFDMNFDDLTICSFNLVKSVIQELKFENLVLGFNTKQIRSIRRLLGKELENYQKYLHPIWYKDYEKHPEAWFKTKSEYLSYFEKIKNKIIHK